MKLEPDPYPEPWRVCWTSGDVVLSKVFPSKPLAEDAHDRKMRANPVTTVWIEKVKIEPLEPSTP